MKYKRVIGLAAPLLLQTAAAHAAGSGTPVDAVATQIVTVLSGPVALIMVAAGFVGAGIVYFMSRDFGHAFITLGGLAIGGVLCSQIQPMATFFFPAAIATVEVATSTAPALPVKHDKAR
jgi:type IV secretory pathway VirB2 component (pilin)